MPKIPFLIVGVLLLWAAQRVKVGDAAKKADLDAAQAPPPSTADTPEELLDQMRVHALEILLAPDIVDLVSGSADDLLARVKGLRRKVAFELGIVVPPVRTRDSVELAPSTYVIRLSGVELGRGTAPAGRVLALGDDLDELPGHSTVEPVFGLTGKWIPVGMRHSAELAGATVIDRVSVVVTHLSSIIAANADRLLTREDVRTMTDSVRQTSPAAVEELTPTVLTLAEVQRVLQGLLAERVPINDLARIYEALALRARASTEPEGLIEAARAALGPALAAPHVDEGTLRVIMIDPGLEQRMLEGLRPSDAGTQIALDATSIEEIIGRVARTWREVGESGSSAVLVCAPALRPAIRRLVAVQAPDLAVLSYQEVTALGVAIETIGVIRVGEQLAA
jgi:flagellar biosynthesis protein FlhA